MLEAGPIILVKNEAIYIERVLRPLVEVFGLAVVGDTGSTDGTAEIAAGVPGVIVQRLGALNAWQLGQARRDLGRVVLGLGRRWAFQVDGDELYSGAALLHVAQEGLPAGAMAGYTTMVTLDRDDGGQLWEMDDLFNRLAVFAADDDWSGEYPFEAPKASQARGPLLTHYFSLPAEYGYHAVHLHRLERSPQDGEVYWRQRKQFQFALREVEVKRTVKFDLAAW